MGYGEADKLSRATERTQSVNVYLQSYNDLIYLTIWQYIPCVAHYMNRDIIGFKQGKSCTGFVSVAGTFVYIAIPLSAVL